ncbi:MAG TPA: hypothetical protein VLG74_17220 [Blastocatellia bacterium]|nr:hypothetical protein [Blastocatellia bacterium]
MDFKPRLPLSRLTLLLLVFCFLTLMFILETKTQLEYKSITDLGFMAETVFVGLILLSFISFMLPYLLLQHRLRFTEEGIHRRTMLKPRFIPWRDVKRARMGSVAIRSARILLLELCVCKWRWVWIPLLEYRRGAILFEEIRKRLPVEVEIRGSAQELLRDE